MHKMTPSVFRSSLGKGYPCLEMAKKQSKTSIQRFKAEKKALVIRVSQSASLKLQLKYIIASRHYRIWACYMSKIA